MSGAFTQPSPSGKTPPGHTDFTWLQPSAERCRGVPPGHTEFTWGDSGGGAGASDTTSLAQPSPPTAGGREVDTSGVNAGVLRCARCTCRLLTGLGKLVEKPDEGEARTLWIPRPIAGVTDRFNWDSARHAWWWEIADIDDLDNIGMSALVEGPAGPVRLALCPECGAPLGHRMGEENLISIACDAVQQQARAAANDKKDFEVDESNPQYGQLKAMMAQRGLAKQFNLTFEEGRLGMMLDDAPDGIGVQVYAFTEAEGGGAGAAELCGQVRVADKVVRVQGVSTKGMGFADVLDLVVSAPRPLELRFERMGGGGEDEGGGAGAAGAAGGGRPPARVQHEQWELSEVHRR